MIAKGFATSRVPLPWGRYVDSRCYCFFFPSNLPLLLYFFFGVATARLQPGDISLPPLTKRHASASPLAFPARVAPNISQSDLIANSGTPRTRINAPNTLSLKTPTAGSSAMPLFRDEHILVRAHTPPPLPTTITITTTSTTTTAATANTARQRRRGQCR